MENRNLWFLMGFPGFPYFWRKILRNGRKSSGGGCARPKKRRSSPSGGAKVVSGVIFLSADMFRSQTDIHFFMGETLFLDPPSPGKIGLQHEVPPGGTTDTTLVRLLGSGTCLRTKIRHQRQLLRRQMGSNDAFQVSHTRPNYFSGHFEVIFFRNMKNL